ncbi:MAG: fumarylacetoacetate hydrolase family protein [Prevotella sp.]|nr:fumarylacetoacetate hydrolase family protein [Prevotella sp.]
MKILAIGMNYIQHNKELDGALYKPKEPVIFSKVDSALLKNGKPFFIPDELGSIDYEAELVVRICKLGKTIPQRFAYRYYDAVTVGIDFTARDLQRQLRAEGKPWEMSKSFDGSAVIGKWIDMKEISDIQALNFRLDINGNTVQNGYSGDMLFTVDEIIAYVSRNFTLKTGDLLYTGTPVGVGPVHINDHLTGWIEDKKVLEFNVK